MTKKRANGKANIRKCKDGRWENRYTAGRALETGKAIYKNVLARTQKWFDTHPDPRCKVDVISLVAVLNL